jgi:hypothetical protein
MPVVLSGLLSLDAREKEIEVSAGAERGSVRIKIRELPYAAFQLIRLRYQAALQMLAVASSDLKTKATADAALHKAFCEIVRWGVVGHREEDFLLGGCTTPFESTEATFNDDTYRVASDRMLRLYEFAGGGGVGDPGVLLPELAGAIMKFQRPEEATAPGGGDSAVPLPSE